MRVTIICLLCLLACGAVCARGQERSYPSFSYGVAQIHEIKPHRRAIPVEGIRAGFNQLRLNLTISPEGDVIDASAGGDAESLKYWPEIQAEVRGWKFTPFELKGKAATAQVEEYVDLVPPERLPTTHISAPLIRPDSTVTIVLDRSACYGTCPSYTVTISTDGRIVFDGRAYVAALGTHTDSVAAGAVRDLARKFVAADFYSMDAKYEALVTDNPTYVVSITIDGHQKKVLDYLGSRVGMPAVVTELEDEVDTLAQTQRWISSSEGTHAHAR